jgi:hypothetical protein
MPGVATLAAAKFVEDGVAVGCNAIDCGVDCAEGNLGSPLLATADASAASSFHHAHRGPD